MIEHKRLCNFSLLTNLKHVSNLFTARLNEMAGEIATQAITQSLLGSAGKVPLHSEKNKKLAGKVFLHYNLFLTCF